MLGEKAETLTILRQKFNSIPYFDKDLMNAQTFVNYNGENSFGCAREQPLTNFHPSTFTHSPTSWVTDVKRD